MYRKIFYWIGDNANLSINYLLRNSHFVKYLTLNPMLFVDAQ